MIQETSYVILLGVAALFAGTADSAPVACQTPKKEAGACVPIFQCQELLGLVRSGRINENNDFLRNSMCGFEGTTPLVCCPLNDTSIPVVPPVTPKPWLDRDSITADTVQKEKNPADESTTSAPTDDAPVECRTPMNELGSCVLIRECPALLQLLKPQRSTRENVDYLKRSTCGFKGARQQFCCPLNSSQMEERPVTPKPLTDGDRTPQQQM